MQGFRRWLQDAGLASLAATLLEVAAPLGAIGAQVLWIAQPTLSLFWESETIHQWALALEDPNTLADWRASLLEDDTHG
jgi:hypothetical protein